MESDIDEISIYTLKVPSRIFIDGKYGKIVGYTGAAYDIYFDDMTYGLPIMYPFKYIKKHGKIINEKKSNTNN